MILEKTQIKPIGEKYPGYFVSNDGRILEEMENNNFADVSQQMHNGKWVVKLKSAKKKWQLIPVQRIVAQHFLPEPPEGYYKINHKDGNIKNCASYNLTYEDLSVPRYGDKNGRSSLNQKNADDIRAAYASGKHSMKKLAEHYGVAYYTVHCIINNKTWVSRKSS